jgi:hypothetical protein
MGFATIPAVTEPPKSLGPPIVVLVHRTSDNPAGAPDHLTSSLMVIFYDHFLCVLLFSHVWALSSPLSLI